MAVAQLGINVSANTAAASTAMGSLAASIRANSQAIGANTSASQANTAAIATLTASLNTLVTSLNNAGNAANRNRNNFNNLGNGFGNNTALIASFFQVLREGPTLAVGVPIFLLAISNNLPILFEQFALARAAGMSFFATMGVLAKSLFSLQGAITIGITAMVLFSKALFGKSKAAQEADKAEKALAESIKGVNTATGQEIFKLAELKKAAEDVNKNLSERKKAVDLLQKEYPAYFKNLTDEAILTGRVADAYDRARSAIIKQGLAKIANERAKPLFEKLFPIESELAALGESEKFYRQYDAILKKVEDLKRKGQSGAEVNNLAQSGLGLLRKVKNPGRVAILVDQKDYVTKEIEEFFKAVNISYTDGFEDVAKEIKKGKTPFDIDIDALEKNYRQAQAILIDLNTETLKIVSQGRSDAEKELVQKNTELLLNQQSKDVEKTFLEAKLAVYKKYAKDGSDVAKELAGVNNEIAKQLSIVNTKVTRPAAELSKPTGNITPLQLDPKIVQDKIAAEKLRDDLAATATFVLDVVSPAFDSLFDNIGKNGANALKAFGDALAETIKQLGVALIKAAIFAGITSLITGGVAKGGKGFFDIFKGLLGGGGGGFKIPFMADGGVVTRPTLAMIGEAGNEAVIPLSKFGQFAQEYGGNSSGGVYIPSLRIAKNEFFIMFKEAVGGNSGRQ